MHPLLLLATLFPSTANHLDIYLAVSSLHATATWQHLHKPPRHLLYTGLILIKIVDEMGVLIVLEIVDEMGVLVVSLQLLGCKPDDVMMAHAKEQFETDAPGEAIYM